MKNDIDAQIIFNWIAARLLYLACIILVFLGAAFASIFTDEKTNLPFGKQVFALFFSVTLISLLVGYLIYHTNLDPYLMAFLAACLGMGSSKLSSWLLALWQKSDGFEDFFKKIGKIVLAVRKVVNETDSTTNHDNASD